jgi:predicted nucleic acid-binding protein
VIVVDTSALVSVLAGSDADPRLVDRIASTGSLHAPHLLDTEFARALRGLVRRGLSVDRARGALDDLAELPTIRYPAVGLLDRIWELRDTLTAYDATFVALAEALSCPLITCDFRLARAGHTAIVEVFAPA